MNNNCNPVISRKFIRIDGTEFDILLGDGGVFDLRDLETYYGEHLIAGTECTTANLLNFLHTWGVYNSSGSSVYIKTINTVIPSSDTLIGNIPLGDALIIKYHTIDKTMLWLYANDRSVYRYLNGVWSIESLDPNNFVSVNDINTTVAGLDRNGLLNPSVIPDLAKEIVYGINMNALNAVENKSGEILYIDMSDRVQYYWDGNSFLPYSSGETYATQEEAETGTVTDKIISPKTAKDAIEFHKATVNVLESSTLNATTTNNTGSSIKTARKDHTHKVEGFSLTTHTHPRVLTTDLSTGTVITMDDHTIVPIDATTLEGFHHDDFATATQGGFADTAIQDVTLGGVSIKTGTTGILPRYPLNGDFKISLLKDFPTGFTTKKIIVTNSAGGFDLKDYFTEDEHDYTKLTNKPTISLDAVNPTDLSEARSLTGNLKLHPIVSTGLLTSLNDLSIETATENDVLQYKNGSWTNSVLEGLTTDLKSVTFNNVGNGSNPGTSYDGTIATTISYNSVGAAPLSHSHTLSGLSDITFTDLQPDQIIKYNGTKWINITPDSGYSNTLSALTDVEFTSLASTNTLSYNSTLGKWVNIPKYAPANLTFNNSGTGVTSGGVYDGSTAKTISYNTLGAAPLVHRHVLGDIDNVKINNPLTNQVIAYNGTDWINTTSATGTTYALNDLTDTIITSPIVKQVLRHDGKNWVNSILSYNDLDNKPTIPSAPGTLNTTLTTTQTTNASEALTGNISLHKVAKTGTFSDLIGLSLNTPVNGEVLKYNGTNWVNGPDNTGGGGTIMYVYDIAFVDAGGNDSTAIIGDVNHPFSTLATAITAVLNVTPINNRIPTPVIQVMSDLTINTPIMIDTDVSITINLLNGIVINYLNVDTPYVAYNGTGSVTEEIPNSLFNIKGINATVKITSNGSSKIICTDGTSVNNDNGTQYSSSFATLGGIKYTDTVTLELQNITIEHECTVAQIMDNYAQGVASTIMCNDNSLLKINNCHILTANWIEGTDITCYNIKLRYNNIIELNNTKLTILSNAYGGNSRHVFNVDVPSKISLLNCQTVQLLKHANLSTLTGWSVAVVGTEYNNSGVSSHVISNCKFYIGNNLSTRNISSSTRINVTSINASAIRIGSGDTIEYLGVSLHNYGNTFNSPEPTPTQYGGLAATSLVKCPLLQPYEIDYTF